MSSKFKRFPWAFLLFGFALSWGVWIPVAFTGKNYHSSPCLLIGVLLGAFGPGLTAIGLTYLQRNQENFNEFRQRIYQIRRIRPAWLLIIVALWPALHLIAIAIARLAGTVIPASPFLDELLSQPNTIPLIIFMYFLQAGLEEIGWRGYLQEKLGHIFAPALSVLFVGLIHTIWYLPLFWIAGTNQIQMGFGPDFLIFIAFMLSSSVYAAWCYYGNNHSVFAAALLHTTGNLSFDIFSYAPGTLKHLIFVALMAAGAIPLLWHLNRLPTDDPAVFPSPTE